MSLSQSTFWFSFEETFNPDLHYKWFRENWTISIWLSIVYVLLVFGGKTYMKSRDKFNLRMPLAIWSSALAIFSTLGMLRTVPELFYLHQKGPFLRQICDQSLAWEGPFPYWIYIFTASKAIELVDTFFIVLRKQKLVFLHWYHHITVMIYCFYSYGQVSSPTKYFMVMNCAVHSVMYSYYALRAFRIQISQWVNIVITSLQTLQMVIGIIINSLVVLYQYQGHDCEMSPTHTFFTYAMYASYFVLFANFFYQSYVKPKSKQQTKVINQNGKVKES